MVVLAGGFVVLTGGLMAFGSEGRGASRSYAIWELAAFLIGYVIALVAALDFVIKWRRDDLVRAILLTGVVDIRWNGATWPKQKLVERKYLTELESQRRSVRKQLKDLPRPETLDPSAS